MKNWPKKYPPCKGGEPYLYFAFAEPDSEKVWPVMRILLGYGCRVWYCLGPAGSAEELLERQTRSGEAELTLLYLSDAACADNDTKTNVLVNQKYDRPILCLDPDGKDRHLAMGLRESVPLIDWHNLGREERETALLHGEGFSQELLGEPVKVRDTGIFRILTLLFLVSAVLASASASAYVLHLREVREEAEKEPEDEVSFEDSAVLAAVRRAAGGGVITEEAVREITFLELDSLPESWEDLDLLPSLSGFRIPQQALLEGGDLPEGDYTIELGGGGL